MLLVWRPRYITYKSFNVYNSPCNTPLIHLVHCPFYINTPLRDTKYIWKVFYTVLKPNINSFIYYLFLNPWTLLSKRLQTNWKDKAFSSFTSLILQNRKKQKINLRKLFFENVIIWWPSLCPVTMLSKISIKSTEMQNRVKKPRLQGLWPFCNTPQVPKPALFSKLVSSSLPCTTHTSSETTVTPDLGAELFV